MRKIFFILFTLLALASDAQVIKFTALPKTTAAGSSFVQAWGFHFGSSLGYPSPVSPPSLKWNDVLLTQTQLKTPGYTTAAMKNDQNGTTAVTITIVDSASSATNSFPLPATAGTGIYNDTLLRSGLIVDQTAPELHIRINNLTNGHFYKLVWLGNSDTWRNAVVYFYVGATQSASINESANVGSNATTESASSALVSVQNINPSSGSITFGIHQVSGFGLGVNTLRLFEYTTSQ